MSENRERLDRLAAELMVSGAWASGRLGSDPLADLLAATAVSARDGELAGEEAAVMAFRAAHLSPIPELRRRSMLKTALAKLATAKVAIVLLAVGGGGVALAAGSGNLPGVGSPDSHPTGRPSISVTASENASHSRAAAAGTNSAEAGKSHAPSGTPSPNLQGLCTAFNAGAGDNPGKALDNPAFTVLITTAGGKDKVADYCKGVLASASAAHPTEADSHGSPSTHPSGEPTHPSGAETTPSHPAAPTHTH